MQSQGSPAGQAWLLVVNKGAIPDKIGTWTAILHPAQNLLLATQDWNVSSFASLNFNASLTVCSLA